MTKTASFRVLAISYTSYLFMGLLLTAFGPLIPDVTAYYGVGYAAVGNALIISAVAFLPAVLLGGVWSRRIGPPLVVFIGAAILTAGYVVIARAGSWPLFLTGLIMGNGVGFGLAETGLNTLILHLAAERKGAALNHLHFFPALGAMAGAPICRLIVAMSGRWQQVYIILAVLMAFVAASGAALSLSPTLRKAVKEWRLAGSGTGSGSPGRTGDTGNSKGAGADQGGDSSKKAGSYRQLLKQPVMLVLALMILLYVGSEMGATNWMYSYLVEGLGAGAAAGAALSSLFWLGLCLGRLLSARLSECWGYELLLWRGSLLAAVFFFIGLLSAMPGVVLVAFFLTGFSFASTFPTIMAAAGSYFPAHTDHATGLLMFGTGMGSVIFPPAMGYLAEAVSLPAAMFLAGLVIISLAGMARLLLMLRRKTEAK
ncbi:MAG TPA: MFS transporter [Firmicutes bacterium]|nr:MFS transporter [Bacillota bacterium]